MLARSTSSYKGRIKENDLLKDYKRLKQNIIISLFDNIVLCNTQKAVDSAVTIARYINSVGLNNENYVLYFALLETNNRYVIDNLIGDKNPFLLFSPIRPNWYMLRETFRILSQFKKDELNKKCLLALLGIIQNTYKEPKFGYSVYQLSVSDVYNIGKYLNKKKDQLDELNLLILDILFDIYLMGIESASREQKQVALKANWIRMAFFDNRKKMSDVIPDVLLIREKLPKEDIKPGIIIGDKKINKTNKTMKGD